MPLYRARWILGAIVLIFLLVQLVPILFAYGSAEPGRVFGGFLLNPYDGNSYLAKMRQGYEGAWQFTLPYTAQPGEPTAINIYYLFLGHVSRWTTIPLIGIFHVARLAGALLLCIALYRFLGVFYVDHPARLFSFAIALFGSGFGWLAAAFGGFTADFWWAEAYPFLTAYANPHFAFGLGIQLLLLTPVMTDSHPGWRRFAIWALGGAALSIVYPFGWAATVAILGASLLWHVWQRSNWRVEFLRAATVATAGAPYAIYAFIVVRTHPVLSQWDAQNLTPTPPVWELLIAFSPVILLALVGVLFAFRHKNRVALLAVWAAVIIIAIYAPANLQRRLATGLYIPLAGLAAFSTWQISRRSVRRLAPFAILLLSLPSNALVVAGGVAAVANGDPLLTMHVAEAVGFEWLEANAPKGSLVLAAPQTGLFLPAHASVRVLFGHWFETANASQRRHELVSFFSDLGDPGAILYVEAMDVDYIFYGPREHDLGDMPVLEGWRIAFARDDVQIWSSP